MPEDILNKPAKLTEAEFSKMKSHVVQSIIILQNTPGISKIALDVAAQHHERYDGSGYPNKLKGGQISLYGRMAAIVDVYDALSSDRVYHKAMAPMAPFFPEPPAGMEQVPFRSRTWCGPTSRPLESTPPAPWCGWKAAALGWYRNSIRKR